MPARPASPPRPARERLGERAGACPAPGGRRRRRACRRRAGARPRRRPRTARARAGGLGRRRRSGSSTSTTSPAATRWRLGRASPSTVTRPASISRCAAAREPSARGEERVEPLARLLGSPTSAPRSSDEDQGDDAEGDGDVGDVEGRPVRELDEVGDRAVAHAVDDVAERAAEQQPGRQPDERPVGVQAKSASRPRSAPATATMTSACPPPSAPKATPSLRTWTRSRKGRTSRRSPRLEVERDDRLRQLVERRARRRGRGRPAPRRGRGSPADQADDDRRRRSAARSARRSG